MERLTKLATNHTGNKYVSAIGSGKGAWPQIIQRLAAYEDTGMEPEEIWRPKTQEDQTLYEGIKFEIAYFEMEIDDLQRRLDKEVEKFKAYIAEGDAHRIVSAFRDSRYQFIQSDYIRLNDLRERKRWLLSLMTK